MNQEVFYFEFNYLTNTAAALLREDPSHVGQRQELIAQSREKYRLRLDKDHIAQTQGHALNSLVDLLLAKDTRYQSLRDAREIKNASVGYASKHSKFSTTKLMKVSERKKR